MSNYLSKIYTKENIELLESTLKFINRDGTLPMKTEDINRGLKVIKHLRDFLELIVEEQNRIKSCGE